MLDNIITATDSYKLGHYDQYPPHTEKVYSYFESRLGAEYDQTCFFGLQSILLNQLSGTVVTREAIEQAAALSTAHFGTDDLFNRAGWEYILSRHNGVLPLTIYAVPDGTVVDQNNVLMTVENNDPNTWWLTNVLESLLVHTWYPSTVATRSREVKRDIKYFLEVTADSDAGLPFMLHDFGYRGATTHDAAAIGGAGHLVNFQGTDTLPAMLLAMRDYQASLDTLAFSVPATEHSVMTAMGDTGEFEVVGRLLENHPGGILSVVADSYNIYDFVKRIGEYPWKGKILNRDGVFVVRPDSTTKHHPTPESLVVWILESLWSNFPGEVNTKGYRVLDSHVRVLWGDGIDHKGILKIMNAAKNAGYSVENLVFGMGGGLLQKLNRDTQRFAFKCSAQLRDGKWFDIQKNPLDFTKKSKSGRLKLIRVAVEGGMIWKTVAKNDPAYLSIPDQLVPVFNNGTVLNISTFDQVRERAALT